MLAALLAADKSGIELRGHCGVQEFRMQAAGVEVATTSGRLTGRAVVDCRGAWSGLPVKPRKGQLFYLQPQRAGVLEHVVNAPEVYLVPRSTGKILVGATVEDVGFDKTVDSNAIDALHRAAAALAPELASAPITESWAGLRPGSPDDLPLIGLAEARGWFIATGHFRNGILLAPATAQIMANLVMGKLAGLDISAFSPARFATAQVNTSRNSG
jgi:glycine oxidase